MKIIWLSFDSGFGLEVEERPLGFFSSASRADEAEAMHKKQVCFLLEEIKRLGLDEHSEHAENLLGITGAHSLEDVSDGKYTRSEHEIDVFLWEEKEAK